MALNKKDLELIKGIVVETVEPLKKDITELRKEVQNVKKELSKDNAPKGTEKGTPTQNKKATQYDVVFTYIINPNSKSIRELRLEKRDDRFPHGLPSVCRDRRPC